MFTHLAEIIAQWLAGGGYAVLVITMGLESMVAPVPSEAVMPFAGFLIAQGQWTWLGVIIWSTVGSLLGSIISYFIGLWLGRAVIIKWGKFIGLVPHHLILTENWFKRWGSGAIFICRFIPVVRHLISIPAGMAKMPLSSFIILTGLGAAAWNSFLAWVGVILGEHWEKLHQFSRWIDILVVIILIGLIIWWLIRRQCAMVKKDNLIN